MKVVYECIVNSPNSIVIGRRHSPNRESGRASSKGSLVMLVLDRVRQVDYIMW
jgi:hypothetical protein